MNYHVKGRVSIDEIFDPEGYMYQHWLRMKCWSLAFKGDHHRIGCDILLSRKKKPV
jgi:hypothetical protein